MLIFGLGLHVLIAACLAIDAIRTGHPRSWLPILFMLPLLGGAAYFIAVLLPRSRLRHELRAARRAFDVAPNAQTQLRLAAALLDAGEFAQAADQYDACLRGTFAGESEVAFAAARAKLAANQPQAAIGLLVTLRAKEANFRPEQIGMLLAGAYAAAGRQEEAGAEYEAMAQCFGTIEARAGLALWAITQGKRALAERELDALAFARKHLSRDARGQHHALFSRLDAASAAMRQGVAAAPPRQARSAA